MGLPGNLVGQTLVGSLVVDMGIQLVGWAFACALKSERFYDLFGSLTFISLTVGTLVHAGYYSARQVVLTVLVLLWALRLGTFLVVRIMRDGVDTRFTEAKESPLLFLVFWLMQGVWVFCTLLPILLVNSQASGEGLGALDYVGIVVWALGFVCEAVADYQKFVFKLDPANRGRFIKSGLWRHSRHPNYFGEMVMWWAILIVAASSLSSWKFGVAFIGPVVVCVLLNFVSGVPLLEKAADERWGGEEEYQEYKRTSNVLVPVPIYVWLW